MSKHPASGSVPVPALALSPKEAARALGIGERLLWSITADRDSGIPHLRLGRRLIYPTRELQDWLAERATAEGKR